MTADVRDRILGLLTAGPATVGRLSAGLGVPGGVVSYELALLQRDGLVRVGTTRRELGVATPVYVSTAMAAPPPLSAPVPLPNLTWIGDDPYPAPLWTVAYPPTDPSSTGPSSTGPTGTGPSGTRSLDAGTSDAGTSNAGTSNAGTSNAGPSDIGSGAGPDRTGESALGAVGTRPTGAYTGISFPTRPRRPEDAVPTLREHPGRATTPASGPGSEHGGAPGSEHGGGPGSEHGGGPGPWQRGPAGRLPQPRRAALEASSGPRLHDVRRVPMDEATFYEFARRLDALAREFAARATPGAATAELSILLTRPDGDGTSGYGYGS